MVSKEVKIVGISIEQKSHSLDQPKNTTRTSMNEIVLVINNDVPLRINLVTNPSVSCHINHMIPQRFLPPIDQPVFYDHLPGPPRLHLYLYKPKIATKQQQTSSTRYVMTDKSRWKDYHHLHCLCLLLTTSRLWCCVVFVLPCDCSLSFVVDNDSSGYCFAFLLLVPCSVCWQNIHHDNLSIPIWLGKDFCFHYIFIIVITVSFFIIIIVIIVIW